MENKWLLSPTRQLTNEEISLVWQKPATHIESDAERRICREIYRNWSRGEMKITNILLEGDAGSGKTQLAKALSANFGLPYTKITCFADMDKSDILGAILPVLSQKENNKEGIVYEYYPSEIVRAYENGWLLEIQEPTVIRDASVLMALNSALEPDGSINLPTRIVHRHPDFIAVITTNRGYNGNRPLNEALRDRVQHSEKMDLPTIEVMVQRAVAKTGCSDRQLLLTLAEIIISLDKTAKANAIKGVSGMRSYFFWVDAVNSGGEIKESLYHKVIYKITTDPDEIAILERALAGEGLLKKLEELAQIRTKNNGDVIELQAEGIIDAAFPGITLNDMPSAMLSDTSSKDVPSDGPQKSADGKSGSPTTSENENTNHTQRADTSQDGAAIYHELEQPSPEEVEQQKRDFRKHLNKQARELVKGSVHEKINLIVHRPESTPEHRQEYQQIATELMPVIRELSRKALPLLEHEISTEHAKPRVYGTKFHAERLASGDFHYFSKKNPPTEEPSLAVALRIDESASMSAFGRLEAAKRAAVAVYEFCASCKIPILIYGDTADRSPLERMSLYSYIDYENPKLNDKYCLMAIQGHSNNRDGMALRILAERLVQAPQRTKLLISISDGQPKAMPDYTGAVALTDMKDVIGEFSRKGVAFLAAAIGQDKETISDIYGQEHFIDITELGQLPTRLVQIIARYFNP